MNTLDLLKDAVESLEWKKRASSALCNVRRIDENDEKTFMRVLEEHVVACRLVREHGSKDEIRRLENWREPASLLEEILKRKTEPVGQIEFEVPKEALEKRTRFVAAHRHEGAHTGAIGGHIAYAFCPTSIGMVISIKCSVCGEAADLSGDL